MVIVSKDTDFSDRVILTHPPPRVVHIRIGNMRIRDFHAHMNDLWPRIVELTLENRLVRVYRDRLETVE
jgi:predicted nuclease of predicted toxin-antitoxin system